MYLHDCALLFARGYCGLSCIGKVITVLCQLLPQEDDRMGSYGGLSLFLVPVEDKEAVSVD
jgi:hypothetical protein